MALLLAARCVIAPIAFAGECSQTIGRGRNWRRGKYVPGYVFFWDRVDPARRPPLSALTAAARHTEPNRIWAAISQFYRPGALTLPAWVTRPVSCRPWGSRTASARSNAAAIPVVCTARFQRTVHS